MGIQALLCVNHFSKHMPKKHQPGSTVLVYTNCLYFSKCGECCTRCGNISLPLVEHKFSLTSRYEPEPYVRTTATNGDHEATAETPTATTTPGADENDDDPEDEHEHVNTETDNNIQSKKVIVSILIKTFKCN